MIRNYFLTAIRNLLRHRIFSFINIFGLAIGLTICMGIIMLVADQLTYDLHNSKRDRIFRVVSQPINADGFGSSMDFATSPPPIGPELTSVYTGIEKAGRLKKGFGNDWIEIDQDINIPLSGFYADPEILDILEYPLELGDPRTALAKPFSVVITKKAAKKLFTLDNPVGQVIRVGELGLFTVTGVLKETNKKSHVVFEALASMATVESLEAAASSSGKLSNWHDYYSTWTYLLLEKGRSSEDIVPHLEKIYQQHIATQANPDITKTKFRLQRLGNITPGPLLSNSIGPFLPWLFLYFLGGLAVLIIITSAFNFTNLSIARSLNRAKEIGIRKVSGAARSQIFFQFIAEAVVTAMLALGLSLLLLFALKPLMLDLNFARLLKWDLESNFLVYVVFVVFAALVGIVAGFFPAVVLSGFQPVKVLKNLSGMKILSRTALRKVLLVTQFTMSLIFILSVILVYNQLSLFLKADHGFDMSSNIVVRLGETKPDALKAKLLQHSHIVSASASSHVPAAGRTHSTGLKRSLEEKDWTEVSHYAVDEDYLENLTIPLIAGRYFIAGAGDSNRDFIVINEASVKYLHFSSPADALGEVVILQDDSTKKEIIGVIKDYNHQVLFAEIGPLAHLYNPEELNILQVKYNGNQEDAIATLEAAWKEVNPSLRVDYKIFEDEIKGFYNLVFGDVVNIVGVISVLAIIISCLGLLGMVTYTTEIRMKEISIRKILGAGHGALVYLLSKGFLRILLLSVLIAVPVAYYLNNLWLEHIAYRTTFDMVVIAIGVGILVLFAAITIGSQTLRAATVNPVDNLKNE